jgi:hypothetical protein
MAGQHRWDDIKARGRTPEQMARLSARVARHKAIRDVPTGDPCARCLQPLRYGDRTVTLASGSVAHAACDEK